MQRGAGGNRAERQEHQGWAAAADVGIEPASREAAVLGRALDEVEL
jgi:hypothetical protein